jgi:hypothetical protein
MPLSKGINFFYGLPHNNYVLKATTNYVCETTNLEKLIVSNHREQQKYVLVLRCIFYCIEPIILNYFLLILN